MCWTLKQLGRLRNEKALGGVWATGEGDTYMPPRSCSLSFPRQLTVGLLTVLSHGLCGGRHGPGDPRLSSGPRVEEDREEGMLGRILSPKDTHVLLPVKIALYMAKGTLQVWLG